MFSSLCEMFSLKLQTNNWCRFSWTSCGIWSIFLSIIEYLWRAKQPYNVSAAAEISACAALQNPTYLEVNSCPIGVVHIYTNHLI